MTRAASVVLAVILIALAFAVGRATSPEPAQATLSDATLSDLLTELKAIRRQGDITNRSLGGFALTPARPALSQAIEDLERSLGDDLEMVCRAVASTPSICQ